MSLRGAERRQLRRMAHPLKPAVQTGGAGLTEAVVAAVDEALADHELIKVRIPEERAARAAIAEAMAERTGSELAGMVGQVAILYRPAADPARRRIVLGAAPPEAAERRAR